jgi:hypothetical protein
VFTSFRPVLRADFAVAPNSILHSSSSTAYLGFRRKIGIETFHAGAFVTVHLDPRIRQYGKLRVAQGLAGCERMKACEITRGV